MKKLLAVFLALMMILSVSLMACGDKNDDTNNDDELNEDDDFVPSSTKAATGTTEANSDDDDESEITKAPASNAWTSESGTVYVRANGVNIRASNKTTSTVIGNASFGDALQYEAYNGDWFKIKFNGTTAYISAIFVTGNQNTVIFEEHATLKAGTAIKVAEAKTCNLRTDPAVADSTLKGSIDATKTANGELTIVKINKTGTWAEVRFKGTDIEKHTYTGEEVLYCTTEYIVELMGTTNSNTHG